jgi:adenylosuccinate lyase
MRRNVELTQGIIFSQRVLLALIDKGLSRQEAYKIVQENAMKAWEKSTSFQGLLQADRRITARLSRLELSSLFGYNYYLKHVDEIFERLHLGKTTRRRRAGKAGSAKLPCGAA